MNKYKVLGAMLMVSIIIMILTAWNLGMTSIQYAISGNVEFLSFLSLLLIVMLGSFTALTLDNMTE